MVCKIKKLLRQTCCVIVVALLSFSTYASDFTIKQIQLKKVTGKLKELQKNLAENKSKQVDLQTQLEDSEKQLSDIAQQMTSLNKQLAEEEKDLNDFRKSQQILIMKLSKQKTVLAQHLRAIYLLGHMQSLKTLLNPDDINTIHRHLHYYRQLSETRFNLITDVKKSLAELNNNMTVIAKHENNLKKLLQQKHAQQRKAQKAQDLREKTISQLHLETQSKQQELAVLFANQKALQDMLANLQAQTTITQGQPFNKLQGRLQWPLPGTIITAVGGSLGVRDTQISGVTIRAPEGTPVQAVSGGKVIFANWLRGFGLLVIINHGDGYMSLYARNHALYAKAGDTVKPRDVIASIGNSGGYKNPSLYFEIRKNGTPVDPRIFCR